MTYVGADAEGLARLIVALDLAASQVRVTRLAIEHALFMGHADSSVPGTLAAVEVWCADRRYDLASRIRVLEAMNAGGDPPWWAGGLRFLTGDTAGVALLPDDAHALARAVWELFGQPPGALDEFVRTSRLLRTLDEILTPLSVVVDVAVLIDPPSNGLRGHVDRAVAAAELVGLAVGAPLVVGAAATYWVGTMVYDHRERIVALAESVAALAEAAAETAAAQADVLDDVCEVLGIPVLSAVVPPLDWLPSGDEVCQAVAGQ